MGSVNYLPFVLREGLVIPAGEARSISIISSIVSGTHKGSRIIYQDFSFSAVYEDLLLRYGFEKRGFLQEEPQRVGHLVNRMFPYGSISGDSSKTGWWFPRPYRLDPGQGMIASVQAVDPVVDSTAIIGVTLSCKREDNGEPYTLYGMVPSEDQGTQQVISGTSMTAPAETPLLVECFQCTGKRDDAGANPRLAVPVECQLYDGNGREILTTKTNTGAAAAVHRRNWMHPALYAVELGERRGWALNSEFPLMIELENANANTDRTLAVTIRGCTEVLG